MIVNRISDKEKDIFLHNPDFCPFCHSVCIEVGNYHFKAQHIIVDFKCCNCKKKWSGVYKIEFVKETK